MAFDEQIFAPSEGATANERKDSTDHNLFQAAYSFAQEHPEAVAAGAALIAAGGFLAAKRFGLLGLADDAAKVWDPKRGPATEALIARGLPIRPDVNALRRVDDSVWNPSIRPATESLISNRLPITPQIGRNEIYGVLNPVTKRKV